MSEETNVAKPSVIGMITSPVQQFKRLKERPFILPAMLIVVITMALGTALQGLGEETPELEGAGSTTFIIVILAVVTVILAIIITMLGILIMSAIHMLVAKIATSPVSFKQLFSMNTYVFVISALGLLVNGIAASIIGVEYPGMEFTSLGSLVNNPGDMSAIAGIWDSIEVFSIWGYIITAIGLQIVAGFSKKMAWSVVVVIFLLTIMIELMSSALAGIGGV
ncbi:MAG TPA: Yip1 family protein [Pseudogracilibacillus sp.]|nr:Yip1 family protein [Pseudogracilibacillus sp.]